MAESQLEAMLAFQLRAAGLPAAAREYRFAPPRRWRFDFCWPDSMLAVEVDGGSWVNGRHTRGRGFQRDLEKLNAAAEMGFTVLRYTAEEIKNGSALAQIERVKRRNEY